MRCHDAALAAYYYASLPLRAVVNANARRQGRFPVMILFYHRVADTYPNEWTISTRQFRHHIDWLTQHFELISLAECQRRLRSAFNDRPCVSITFDDGYADNCHFALPLLTERKIPFTYFVSLRNVQDQVPFPHDARSGQPLRPNTIPEIVKLAEAGVEIGAHTMTHADLGQVNEPEQLRSEIVQCKLDLEELIDRPVHYFAFPFGQHRNLSRRAFQLARQAGYSAVCSAYGGYNVPGDDPFHLQRIHADPDMIRLRNWLTVDPRKWSTVQRFDCTDAPEMLSRRTAPA